LPSPGQKLLSEVTAAPSQDTDSDPDLKPSEMDASYEKAIADRDLIIEEQRSTIATQNKRIVSFLELVNGLEKKFEQLRNDQSVQVANLKREVEGLREGLRGQ
jgi:hypothetical protein